jgi:hypothetical protein
MMESRVKILTSQDIFLINLPAGKDLYEDKKENNQVVQCMNGWNDFPFFRLKVQIKAGEEAEQQERQERFGDNFMQTDVRVLHEKGNNNVAGSNAAKQGHKRNSADNNMPLPLEPDGFAEMQALSTLQSQIGGIPGQ